jgi:hypothetical protein
MGAPWPVLVAEGKQGLGFGERADEIVEIRAMRLSGADRVAAGFVSNATAAVLPRGGTRPGPVRASRLRPIVCDAETRGLSGG